MIIFVSKVLLKGFIVPLQKSLETVIPADTAPPHNGPITSIQAVQVTGPVPTLLIPSTSKMAKNRSLKSILDEYLRRIQIGHRVRRKRSTVMRFKLL